MANTTIYIPPNYVPPPDETTDDVRRKAVWERYSRVNTYWSPIFDKMQQDDQFVAGEQWDSITKKEREREGRPCLTYNLLPAFTRQIVNRIRQDRPQLRVKPVESDRHQTPDIKNVQGTQDYTLADVYNGILRNIEHLSRADQAYDTAATHCVWHGYGVFIGNNRPSASDPFVQDLVIERVRDPYTVLLDPGAQAADFSDAQDAFMYENMTQDAFRLKYPEATSLTLSTGVSSTLYADFYDRAGVTVITYYWVDHVEDEVIKMSNGKVHYMSDVEDVLDEMAELKGVYPMRDQRGKVMRKATRRPVVMWQKMTASEMLTEPTETPFRMIPIFPVLGDELLVNGRVEYSSAVRDAKDAQKSYNYWRTAATETIALAPKAPFIVTEDQIRGRQRQWSQANKSAVPYLAYNFVEGQPVPTRAAPPQPAAAELAQAASDAQDMQAIIGLHEADLGAESNERSGRAIQARQRQGAIGTFTYPANLGRAMEAMGRCFLDAIPVVYDSQRVVRVRLPDDTEDFVEINQVTVDRTTGKERITHDLGYGRYDCVIDTGPSYQTLREESIDAMLELLKVLPPEVVPAVVHLMVKEMGFPGSDKVAIVLRKMLPDNLKSEDDRAADLPKGVKFNEEGQPVWEAGPNAGQPYQPPLTPEQQVQQTMNQIEQQKLLMEGTKAEADQALARAKIAEAEAKQAKAAAELAAVQAGPVEEREPGPSVGDLRQMVMELLEEHREDPQAHKDVIDEEMADTLADLLPRIRRLVEKAVNQEVTTAREEDRTARESESAKAERDNDKAALKELQSLIDEVKEGMKRPKTVQVQTDADGNVTALVPKYA